MARNTAIGWTDSTFNMAEGCAKVSPGCENCYAERMSNRFHAESLWGPGAQRLVHSDAYWQKPLGWNKEAQRRGKPRLVFASSFGDVFEDHPTVNAVRMRFLALVRRTPWLTWQILTKRPENIRRMLRALADQYEQTWLHMWLEGAPPPNVWLGTSIESTKWGEKRIPHLLSVPAALHFLSCEPLLSLTCLNFDALYDRERWLADERSGPDAPASGTLIGWVIAGAESGPSARPMPLMAAEFIRDQCAQWKIPFFMKQFADERGRKILDMEQWPDGLRIQQIPAIPIPA